MGGDHVRAAVAERSWNSFTLAGTHDKIRADDEADLSGALSRLIVEAGQPDIVISALPANLAVKRLLELPFKDARRLHQVVPFALEEHLPFPVDNGAVAFTRVGREGDSTLVMAAMVRKTDLQNHLDLLQKAGLDPKTVTLAPLALAAMFTRTKNGNGAKPMAHLVVEGDESSTSVVLVDLGGTPRALRSMPGGLMMSDGSAVSAGCGRADSQLGASDPAGQWRGNRPDRGDRRGRRGGLSESARDAVRLARDVGARRRRVRLHRPLRGHGAQHRQVFIVHRDAAGRVANQAARSDQFPPGRIHVPRPRPRRSQPVLYVGDPCGRAVGRAHFSFRARRVRQSASTQPGQRGNRRGRRTGPRRNRSCQRQGTVAEWASRR